MVFYIYTKYHFDSLKSVNSLINLLSGTNFPLFETFGTSEQVNRKIVNSNFKAIELILSDYPLHSFGEIYFRAKNKKFILKVENKAESINRWVLFISDFKYENNNEIKKLYPFLEKLISKYSIFFIGGDNEETFNLFNTKASDDNLSNSSIQKVGIENIRQLPGIYWFNYLNNAFIPSNTIFCEILKLLSVKPIDDGLFIVLTNKIENDDKFKIIPKLINCFEKNLFFDKNKKQSNHWALGKIINEQTIKQYSNSSIPYFDIYKRNETSKINWSSYNNKNIDELIKKFDNDFLEKFDQSKTFKLLSNDINSYVNKNQIKEKEIEKYTICFGILLGNCLIREFGFHWLISDFFIESTVLIPKLAPKKFSPFYFVLQIIVNKMSSIDFINELEYYL